MKISFCLALALCSASILLVLSPEALALDPPPGGGYPNDVTALGTNALFNVGSADPAGDTAIGFNALYNCAGTGASNTAVGSYAMVDTTTGGGNVAVGMDALYANTTGNSNVAVGFDALVANKTGVLNVAVGYTALSGPLPALIMSPSETGRWQSAPPELTTRRSAMSPWPFPLEVKTSH